MQSLRPLHLVAVTIGLVTAALVLFGATMLTSTSSISVSTNDAPATVANLGSTLTPTAHTVPVTADQPGETERPVPAPIADEVLPAVVDVATASDDWTDPIDNPIEMPLGHAVTHHDLDAAHTALERARSAWKAADLADYVLVVREYCRCPDADVEVTVVAHEVADVGSQAGLPFTHGPAPQSMADVLDRAEAMLAAAESSLGGPASSVGTNPCMTGSFRLEFSPEGHLRTLSDVDRCDGGATWTIELIALADLF